MNSNSYHNTTPDDYGAGPSSKRQRFDSFLTAAEYSICHSSRYKKISFGCKTLDHITEGGVQTSGITEISGEAGSGKTQLCMQLSVMVQLSESDGGQEKGTLYICTEQTISGERLMEIIKSVKLKSPESPDLDKLMDSILIQLITGCNEFINCIVNDLPKIMKQRKIGLIVVDSIAGIFRGCSLNTVDRAYAMREVGDALESLSETHSVAVVCTNQVTSFNSDGTAVTTPALGLAWSNLVDTRFFIQRNDRETNVRKFEIDFCSYLPYREALFQVTGDGIVEYYEKARA